jgi:outer membrane protein, heavy metal efflux system
MIGIGLREKSPNQSPESPIDRRVGRMPASKRQRRLDASDDRRSIGMDGLTSRHRSRWSARAWTVSAVLILLSATAMARAQGPQFDVGAPPGAAGGASTVGQPLGAADFFDYSSGSIAPISGKAGPGGTHVPASSLAAPPAPVFRTSTASQFAVQPIQEANVPAYGDLDLPEEMEGPENGMTIDAAIELLVKQNLDLEAYRLEIPMADADLLTANLRANPVFYADTQLIPYGHYSFLRPGGPPQSDININYPLDVSFKRAARTRSARAARKVTEAQLQDAIRNSIDNLYTVYVDAVSAALTVKFSETYSKGTHELLGRTERLFRGGQIKEADVLAIRAKLEIAELQVREARQAKVKANRALTLILNLPLNDADKLEVRDTIGQVREVPASREDLIAKALGGRPDLFAIRMGVVRANSDVRLAKANAFPDVYLLYQPYTFQNNTYLGVPSAYSWTLGLTASMPLYNRNQGNITRAKINVTQTQIQASSQERQVVSDVLDAAQELEQSYISVLEFRREIIPASAKMRDAAKTLYLQGEYSVLEFLEAQLAFNDVVKQYRDSMVRHRRAVLDLNTAIGERVLP